MKKKILIILLITSIFLASAQVVGSADDKTWETDDAGNVFIDDEKVFINVYPHTLSSSGYIYVNLTSKVYSGDIDVIFGFNTTKARPKKAELYKPHVVTWNTTISKSVTNVTSIGLTNEVCTYGNEYNAIKRDITYLQFNYDPELYDDVWVETSEIFCFDTYAQDGDNYVVTWYTNHTRIDDYVDYTSSFTQLDYDYSGMNKWYYVKNVPIQTDRNYMLRAFIDIPISLSIEQGKYWVAFKPSDKTIPEAIADSQLYYLDPWWNSSFTYQREHNTSKLSSNIGYLINGSNCFEQNGTKQCVRTVNDGSMSNYYNDNTDIRVVVNDTADWPWYTEIGDGSSYSQADAFGKKVKEFYDFENASGNAYDKVNNTVNWDLPVATRTTANAYVGNKSYRLDVGAGETQIDYGMSTDEFKAVCFPFYLYTTGGGSTTSIVYFVGGFSGNEYFYIGFGRNDGVSIWYYDGTWRDTGVDMNNATWDYYCFNDIDFDAGTFTIYQNGAIISSADMRPLSGYDGYIRNLMHTGYLAGSYFLLDEIAFYNTALTAAEINETYQNYLNTEGYGNLGVEETAPEAPPEDTCTCPISANWRINLADHCNLTANCNIFGFNVSFENGTAGDYFNCTANYNLTAKNFNFSAAGAGTLINMEAGCYFNTTQPP